MLCSTEMRSRSRARPPADAAARIEWTIENAEAAWQLKLAGLRALHPSMSDEEIHAAALASAIRNNPWHPRRAAR